MDSNRSLTTILLKTKTPQGSGQASCETWQLPGEKDAAEKDKRLCYLSEAGMEVSHMVDRQ